MRAATEPAPELLAGPGDCRKARPARRPGRPGHRAAGRRPGSGHAVWHPEKAKVRPPACRGRDGRRCRGERAGHSRTLPSESMASVAAISRRATGPTAFPARSGGLGPGNRPLSGALPGCGAPDIQRHRRRESHRASRCSTCTVLSSETKRKTSLNRSGVGVGLDRDGPAQVAAFRVELVEQGHSLRIGGHGRTRPARAVRPARPAG